MENIFLHLINLSISASWLILAVILLRFLLKKSPKWSTCVLWMLVGIRLIFPFSLESVFSLIPSKQTFNPNMPLTSSISINTGFETIDTPVNSYFNTAAPVKHTLYITRILMIIWIVGIFALLTYTIASYLRLQKRMTTATILHSNIRQSEFVASPFVLGIVHPTIYLPYHMSEEDLNYVIAHETSHIKRKDHLIKPLGFLLLTIYWFNPLMWISYILFCKDIELACDERVIKILNQPERKAYSSALLSCSIHHHSLAACPLAFGEVDVKERIKTILNYKKPTFWISILAIAACFITGICFLTNPKSANTLKSQQAYKVTSIVYSKNNVSAEPIPIEDWQYYIGQTLMINATGVSGANSWSSIAPLEEITLTEENFDAYFRSEEHWNKSITPNVLREENEKTWCSNSTNGSSHFYYILQQKNGDMYIIDGAGVEVYPEPTIDLLLKITPTKTDKTLIMADSLMTSETPKYYFSQDSALLRLYEKNGKFILNYDSSPYLDIGEYSIKNEILTAKTSDGKYTYCFKVIDNNTLTFLEDKSVNVRSTDSMSLLYDGAKFVLQ